MYQADSMQALRPSSIRLIQRPIKLDVTRLPELFHGEVLLRDAAAALVNSRISQHRQERFRSRRVLRIIEAIQQGAGGIPGQQLVEVTNAAICDKRQSSGKVLADFSRRRGDLRITRLDECDSEVG